MKKLSLLNCVLISGIAILVCLSCSTLKYQTGSVIYQDEVQQIDDVAVVALGADKTIIISTGIGFASGESYKTLDQYIDQKEANPFSFEEESDENEVIRHVHQYIFGDFANQVPFNFADENEVLTSSGYKNFILDNPLGQFGADLVDDRVYTPGDYKFMGVDHLKRPGNAQKLADASPPSVDGLMIVRTDTEINPIRSQNRSNEERFKNMKEYDGLEGSSTLMVEGDTVEANFHTRLRVEVLNKQGEPVMKIEEKGKSDDWFTFEYKGDYQSEKSVPALKQSLDNAIANVEAFLKENS